MSAPEPTLDEVVLGAMLEDIGKFMQRAHGNTSNLPNEVMNRASVVLPGYRGRSSHWHALWSDAFFHELEKAGAHLPGGLNMNQVRDAAVYHHRPDTPLHWLSAGMDRKQNDESQEDKPKDADDNAWDAFKRVRLKSLFAGISLGHARQAAPGNWPEYRVARLTSDGLFPETVEAGEQKEAYRDLWPKFFNAFLDLCRWQGGLDAFHEGVIALSEEFTWAIPSSTIDQPDVSLHDHNKSVAAIAACLYRWHGEKGSLGDEAAIKDREAAKFRFLAGDLSGIQSTLFRMQSQGVSGSARILRARSFLMSAIVEAASLLCRREIGLPPYVELQSAGGRFLLLVPNLDGIEAKVEAVRAKLDHWLLDRYLGDLALNLALTGPFRGRDMMLDKARKRDEEGMFAKVWRGVSHAIAAAKLRPLSSAPTGILETNYDDGPDGACSACGVRPAARTDGDTKRCVACDNEHRLGRLLPGAKALLWSDGGLKFGGTRIEQIEMPGGLFLTLVAEDLRDDDPAWARIVSGYRLASSELVWPPATRSIANQVPTMGEDEEQDPRFKGLSEEAREAKAGNLKLFEHLAAQSRECMGQEIVGRPMLAVLKADVDRLGRIFSRGLADDQSIGRMASMSRMFDGFFTRVLMDLLRSEFKNVYTVYAGGDDLLLVGPWTEIARLAPQIEAEFRRYVGHNPEITISAGIELCGVNEPLNRAVRRAEVRLEAAKDAGRNRVSALTGEAITWQRLSNALAEAARISDLIRDRAVSTAFVYKALGFERESRKTEGDGASIRHADWRARWGYHLRRAFPQRDGEDAERLRYFDGLLNSGLAQPRGEGPSGAPEVSLIVALYRNR